MRGPRSDDEHGIHHVYSRGTRRWAMFLDDHDRRQFLRRLATVCARYGIQVLAYCLMDNHYHLIVYCPDKHLSDMQRDLKSLHARLYNDRHRFSGPVFESRFNSKPVLTEENLRNLVRYVHRNPYAIDSAMRLADFPWSSHAVFLGERPCPAWLNTTHGRALFDDVHDYKVTVETPYDGDEVQNTLDLAASPPQRGQARPLWEELSLEEIVAGVARAACVDINDVHPSRRNGLIGLALIIAIDVACYAPNEVAEAFGYRTASAASQAALRSRKRLAIDATATEMINRSRHILRIDQWT